MVQSGCFCGREEVEFAALTSQHRVGHTGIPLPESLSFSFLVQHHKVILLFLDQPHKIVFLEQWWEIMNPCLNPCHSISQYFSLRGGMAYHKDVHSTSLLIMIQGEHLGTGAGTGSTKQAKSTWEKRFYLHWIGVLGHQHLSCFPWRSLHWAPRNVILMIK